MIDELGRMWNEVIMVQFGVLFRDLPGGSVRNHKKSLLGYSISRPRFESRTSRIKVRSVTAWATFLSGSQYERTLTN
jgi:hypothetical protein